ncbi:MAG: hypothetical protein IJD94_05500 [Clostridia bacterium]|nr:hypothetical protein [Clostridia bacterium]
MKNLYRKSALERLSSPDQLDKVIRITSPLSWLALAAVTVVLAIVVTWSIVGTIPETISASGMIVAPAGTNAVYTDITGTVAATHVAVGSKIYMDTKVVTITTPLGENIAIISDQVGTVSEVAATVGSTAKQNSELIRVSPRVQADQVVVCYVPMSSVKKLERGMMAYVTLTAAESETYGHMAARIINIDSRAASMKGMEGVLGADNKMADTFTKDGAVVSVTLELYPDDQTVSGYYWSNEKGANQQVPNGSMCSVRLITKEIRPIEKLFTKIREIWLNKQENTQ